MMIRDPIRSVRWPKDISKITKLIFYRLATGEEAKQTHFLSLSLLSSQMTQEERKDSLLSSASLFRSRMTVTSMINERKLFTPSSNVSTVEMYFRFLLVLPFFQQIQSLDYLIANQQICTNKPFSVPSPHNCSRTRLRETVADSNDDTLIPITIFFDNASITNTSLIVRKSVGHRRLNLTFASAYPRTIYLNNRLPIFINQTRYLSYVYDSLNETFLRVTGLQVNGDNRSGYICTLKDRLVTPAETSTRIYFLYTTEEYLLVDLSQSGTEISPFFSGFIGCFGLKGSLSTLGIVLIVVVCVLSLITTVLIAFWLKRQLKQLYHIWKNWVRARLGLTPEQQIVE